MKMSKRTRLSIVGAALIGVSAVTVAARVPAPGTAVNLERCAAAAVPKQDVTPSALFDAAWADYADGRYDSAIEGFRRLLSMFPKAEQAGSAQFYIAETHYAQGRYRDALTGYDRVISDYPKSVKVPDAYYKRGVVLDAQDDTVGARASWEFASKNYPDRAAGQLSRQRLEEGRKKER
jgi:tol-pal system protein YbgF